MEEYFYCNNGIFGYKIHSHVEVSDLYLHNKFKGLF